ncbi:MAG: class I SAM-dependent methyltransferase [Candidatus Aenigmatarchaeota archaeon]
MKILDLGCGENKVKIKNYRVIGVDKKITKEVDLICDIDRNLPFKDFSFDVVYAQDVLEHLENPFNIVIEVHRILKKNGTFNVKVPFFSSVAAHDTDHKRFFNYSSFDYFTCEKKNYPEYGKYKFKMIKRKIIYNLGNYEKFFWPISKLITFLINLSPKIFQNSLLAYLFPSCYIIFKMKKI